MIKKLISIGIAILTVLSGAILMLYFVINYLAPYLYLSMKYKPAFNEAASIGIIGSADGPTSIIVSSTNRSPILFLLVLFIGGTVYLIFWKLGKNRKRRLNK